MEVETLSVARSLGWKVHMCCIATVRSPFGDAVVTFVLFVDKARPSGFSLFSRPQTL